MSCSDNDRIDICLLCAIQVFRREKLMLPEGRAACSVPLGVRRAPLACDQLFYQVGAGVIVAENQHTTLVRTCFNTEICRL